MSNITVTQENVQPQQVEVIVNGQVRYHAVDGNDADLAGLLNAVLSEAGVDSQIVTKNDDGSLKLNNEVFILRDGQQAPPTFNSDTPVRNGDRVVVGKSHHNG